MTDRQASSPVDACVGARIRERRTDLGLTQCQLGEKIDLSTQQVLKYERGINRISAGRLYEMACALNTPIDYFYEGFDGKKARRLSAHQRRQLDMQRHLDEIHDEKQLEAISQLIRALAGC
jgi:transcriptional regulator with XRE-family HTH domain